MARLRQLLLATLTAATHATACGADPADGAGAFRACRPIGDAIARLECYDAAADAGTPAATRAGPPEPATPPPSAAELFGRDAVESDQIVRRAAGIEQMSELRATVADSRAGPFGKLILTLDNGQVWEQIDSARLPIRIGDPVLVRRAAFGSYLLLRAEGRRAIRVRRTDREPADR